MRNLKVIFFLILFVTCCGQMSAQNKTHPDTAGNPQAVNNPDIDSLRAHELVLRTLGDSVVDGITQTRRIKALQKFIPYLVKTLEIHGSFDYHFDSLTFLKIIEPEDKTFRLLNWALKYNDGTYRYFGAIQIKTDGPLKLIPLRDYRDSLDEEDMEHAISGPDKWIGAIYYKIITLKYKRKTYYTLLGWDAFTYACDDKLVDILTFNDSGEPEFGAPIFIDNKGVVKSRLLFYYASNTSMIMNYIPEYNIITFDHLVPPNPSKQGDIYNYVPDGTYDYLVWKKGKWIWKENLFQNFKKPIKEAGN